MPKTTTTTTPPPITLDIIFLDMDGVILPFGDGYTNLLGGGVQLTYTDGCIFPNATMEALTELLVKLHETRIVMEGGGVGDGITMNAKIVLSSSWRSRPKFVKDILRSFRIYVASRAGGGEDDDARISEAWASALDDDGNSFFDVTDTAYHSTRYDEIINWVHNAETNGRDKFIIRSWIALDDEDLVNVEGRIMTRAIRHAVRTVSSVGLTLNDVNVGIRLLDEQVREYHNVRGGGAARMGPYIR
jgi:hypothetical protein